MASKKLPTYVHCAKCGYRGVAPEHDCTKVRAATAAVVEQAARRQESLHLPAQPEDVAARQALDGMFRAEVAHAGGTVEGVPWEEVEAPLSRSTKLTRQVLEDRRRLGRPVTYVDIIVERGRAATKGLVEIQQRCAVCCSDINKRVLVDTDEDFWGLKLGAEARKAYLLHRCPPVSDALQGFTYEELEALKQDLERDSQRLLERVVAIDALEKARPR